MRFQPVSRVTTDIGRYVVVPLNQAGPHVLKVQEDVPRTQITCGVCGQEGCLGKGCQEAP